MARRISPSDVRAEGGRARAGGRGVGGKLREEGGGGACLPRLFFLMLVGLLGLLGWVEVGNGLRRPSLLRVEGGGKGLVFYQRGRAEAREAWLFEEPEGSGGRPRLLQRIDCGAPLSELGELRWTADGRAIYAAGERPGGRGVPTVRWMCELGAGESQLVVSRAGLALRGGAVLVEGPKELGARWRRHGGAGAEVVPWYELGKQGAHLFSWQATRWEQELPR